MEPPKFPISLCLIAKNEHRHIRTFNNNIRPYLTHPDDEIVLVDTGSEDDTPARAKKLGWRVICRPDLCSLDLAEQGKQWCPAEWEEWSKNHHLKGGLLRSFAEARQISFDAAKNDICMWLDLDDELAVQGPPELGPKALRSFIDQSFSCGRAGSLYLYYAYSHDHMGTCNTLLWRERVVDKKTWVWKGRCHEVLIPRDPSTPLFMARDVNFPVVVKHIHPKPHKFGDLRNYIIQRDELERVRETGEWEDPRTKFYVGNSSMGLGRWDEALEWYAEFVKQSGNKDDILHARLMSATAYMNKGRPWRALEEALEAQRLLPNDPRPYYMQATIWYKLECWKQCLDMIRVGDQFEVPDSLHVVDPIGVTYQPAAMGVIASRELLDADGALKFAHRAIQERPYDPNTRLGYQDIRQWAAAEKNWEAIVTAAKMAKGDPNEILRRVHLSPHLLARGFGEAETAVPDAKGRKTVAIWCGHTPDPWGPDSVKTGIGASEKMVVELAKRLAARGLSVTVYCHLLGEEGEFDGVNWRHSARFAPELYRDYLILWRSPQALGEMPFRAGKIYVWMHDVGSNAVWTPKRLALVDKVLFLSKFQRSLHPSVPEELVCYTRNGVDLDTYLYDGRPKQKKIVFASSPDRGWQSAIELFRKSGLEKDGWTLHMFYGFGKLWRTLASNQEYGYMAELGKERRLLEYEDECLAMCDGKTVINRGRVGWKELAEELKDAWIWLYPTKFDEISCVIAMEAMAAGCVCISTDKAALAETMADYPLWINLSESPESFWWELLANWGTCALETNVDRDQEPQDGAEHAWRFDVDKLADQWVKELFDGEPECTDDGTVEGSGATPEDG